METIYRTITARIFGATDEEFQDVQAEIEAVVEYPLFDRKWVDITHCEIKTAVLVTDQVEPEDIIQAVAETLDADAYRVNMRCKVEAYILNTKWTSANC